MTEALSYKKSMDWVLYDSYLRHDKNRKTEKNRVKNRKAMPSLTIENTLGLISELSDLSGWSNLIMGYCSSN